jgi:hypothetical protein
MGETDSSIESFIGIIVTKTDLQFDGFDKLAGLASSKQIGDSLLEEIRVNFAHK